MGSQVGAVPSVVSLVSLRCVLQSPIHMEYVTVWRDSLDTVENVWLHCNLGSLIEETISPGQGSGTIPISVNQ